MVRVGSFQMDLRMYGAIRTGQPSDADARVGGYPAFSARLKAVPGTAARLEAGNRKGGFACLFQVCAVLLHQVCADGSVFFCRRLSRAGLSEST